MPKGYWMVRAEVADMEKYQAYLAANQAPFREYGARYLARSGRTQRVEGTGRSRNVILEFPSYEAALTCWQSPGYQAAIELRKGCSTLDIVVIEGYEGPQPG